MNGIVMTGDSVRAIRDGLKTQTRRLMNPQPEEGDRIECFTGHSGYGAYLYTPEYPEEGSVFIKPRYRIGETVYVKEAWDLLWGFTEKEWRGMFPSAAMINTEDQIYCYKADFGRMELDYFKKRGEKWRSPRFMPEKAARYFVVIEDERAERLHDISHEDILAEGIPLCAGYNKEEPCDCIRDSYRKRWNAIHGPGAWERNDWVFVYRFRTTEKGEGKC